MKSSVFRAYDIRGVYGKDITEKDMEIIGNSLARVLVDERVVVGRDPRLSSKDLSSALISGLIRAGKDAVDVGMVPLGVGSLYAWKRKLPFAYITGSHLTGEWNGVKFFHKNAIGFMEEDNKRIKELSLGGELKDAERKGKVERAGTDKAVDEYVDFMVSKIRPERKLRVLLDCGNGAAGAVARRLFERAGFETEVVFEEPDGNFPNRSPDNSEDPLIEARKRIRESDFGIAYDGDGDRAVIITRNGKVLTPEQTSYIILGRLLENEKGPVVANVECTRVIDDIAGKFNMEVKRIRVGNNFLMDAVSRSGASFGVERAGHYVIPSLFPADDSLAVSYYFACVMSGKDRELQDIVSEIPSYPFHRFNFDCDDEKKFIVMERLRERMRKEHEDMSTIDGVRISMKDGWALIRASNTSPVIRLTIEGKDKESLGRIRERFSVIIREEMESAQELA